MNMKYEIWIWTCSAEDTDELCNALRAEVNNIAEWLLQNKLSLNTNKTEYMVVDHKDKQIMSMVH